jgi:MFS family permease
VLYIFNWLSNHPNFDKDSSLRAALLDGMYYCLMVGIGESFLSSFAIFLGCSPLQISVLTCTPPLIAAWSQTVGIRLYRKGLSRKKIIVSGAIFQGLSWFGIAGLALLSMSPTSSFLSLLALWVIFSTSGTLIAPVWSSLIGDLIPPDLRGEYFGFRNQRTGWITVTFLLIGGWILSTARLSGVEYLGFIGIFIIAGLARLSSAHWLNQYKDSNLKFQEKDHFSFFDFIKKLPSSNFAKFVLFFSCMNAAANFSGALFPLYILKDLKYSYFDFSILVTIQLLIQFYCMRYWGQLGDIYGNKKIITVCSTAICFSSAVWLISSNFYYMLLCQLYGAIFWSGFGIASNNFMFDIASPSKRAQCAAYMSIVNTTLIFIGTILGGYLVTHLPSNFLLSKGIFTAESTYFKIFLISMILRLIVLFTLSNKFIEVKPVKEIATFKLIQKALGL